MGNLVGEQLIILARDLSVHSLQLGVHFMYNQWQPSACEERLQIFFFFEKKDPENPNKYFLIFH